MILVTERTDLLRALNNLSGIVDAKNTIPILSNCLISTTSDGVKIRATNGDMEASEFIPAHIGAPGTVTVTAQTLRDFVRNLPEGSQISFKLGERLSVSSGRSRINLATLPQDMFPAPWTESWTTEFEIGGSALNAMLSRVAFAQSKEAIRPHIQGVRMESAGVLRLIATNGAALSYVDGPEVQEFEGVTIPVRMVTEALRMASTVESVSIGLSGGKISLSSGSSEIISKLLDSSLSYPDYQRVIPKDLSRSGQVSVPSLVAAIRRAMISAGEGKMRAVRVGFLSDTISVSARNSTSDALDEIDATFDGDEASLSLNSEMLIEVLQSLQGDIAQFSLGGPNDPMTWRAVDTDDGVAVIMPLRI